MPCLQRGALTRLYHETAQRVELEELETIYRYLKCQVSGLQEIQDELEG